ncbi:MAG TPA: TOBE domain-containing protein, partial [Acidimicrobiia bacterium]|nr:TOBE domain-containing protein [Acidimicrobiia bacterium]
GVNLLRGRVVDAGTVRLASGVDLAVADAEPAAGTAVVAIVHPRAVALYSTRPDGSPRNVWSARVVAIDDEGARARVQLAGPVPLVAEITRAAAQELDVRTGVELWYSVKASEVVVAAE